MITSSNRYRSLVIHATSPADRAAIERVATSALRRGDKVEVVVEARGGRALICRVRPSAGQFLTGPSHAPDTHHSIGAALTASLANFDQAFREIA